MAQFWEQERYRQHNKRKSLFRLCLHRDLLEIFIGLPFPTFKGYDVIWPNIFAFHNRPLARLLPIIDST